MSPAYSTRTQKPARWKDGPCRTSSTAYPPTGASWYYKTGEDVLPSRTPSPVSHDVFFAQDGSRFVAMGLAGLASVFSASCGIPPRTVELPEHLRFADEH